MVSKRLKLASSSCTLTFICPFSILIIICVFFMNVFPRIRGISSSYSVSMTTKSTGNGNLSIFTSTSSVTPKGCSTDLSAYFRVIFVFFSLISPIFLTIDKGIRLMLTPKSISYFLTLIVPIIKVNVTLHGSISFWGSVC